MRETEGTTPAPESATPTPCPDGNVWCRTHESEGWCTGRTVKIGEAYLDVTNGTDDGSLAFYGLSYLPEGGIDLDTARQIADTIMGLLNETTVTVCPLGRVWCTEHLADGGQCTSSAIDINIHLAVWLVQVDGEDAAPRVAIDGGQKPLSLPDADVLQQAVAELRAAVVEDRPVVWRLT